MTQQVSNKLQAFHNSDTIKEKYLHRVIQHRNADEIVQGTYWMHGEGCAVGCTIHSRDHENYETQLGIPEWLATLEDNLFEGLSLEDAKKFPEKFLSAIPVGFSDWDKVWHELCIYLISTFANTPERDIRKIVELALKMHETRETDDAEWKSLKCEISRILEKLQDAYNALTQECTVCIEYPDTIKDTDVAQRILSLIGTGKVIENTTTKYAVIVAIGSIAYERSRKISKRDPEKTFKEITENLLVILENQK